jgi:hypothetical protein
LHCESADLCPEANDNCVLLGFYAVSSGDFVKKSPENMSIPSSRVENFLFVFLIPEDGYDM